ncbi:MAG TPA: hypothetical protein VJU61_19710 [Polyangiaceae bacterium]|nr:hypothetical protein [Polyangiaceae bacterium]
MSAADGFTELAALAQGLEPELRALLFEEWSLAARFEHASIASFNKFSLELLAVGAPGELVLAANRASLQEVEHAQACFRVASAYAGKTVGPGPLPIGVLQLTQVNLASITRGAVEDGCVGETLAAAEAAASEQRAQPPILRSVLAKIAREERDHAALAFRFVRWACSVGGPQVRGAARAAFDAALQAYRADVAPRHPALSSALLEAHGRLSVASQTALRQHALDALLEPLRHELFAA